MATTEEMHEHNKREAISNISYWNVCEVNALVEIRQWIEKLLDKAYEAGFKAAKEGQL